MPQREFICNAIDINDKAGIGTHLPYAAAHLGRNSLPDRGFVGLVSKQLDVCCPRNSAPLPPIESTLSTPCSSVSSRQPALSAFSTIDVSLIPLPPDSPPLILPLTLPKPTPLAGNLRVKSGDAISRLKRFACDAVHTEYTIKERELRTEMTRLRHLAAEAKNARDLRERTRLAKEIDCLSRQLSEARQKTMSKLSDIGEDKLEMTAFKYEAEDTEMPDRKNVPTRETRQMSPEEKRMRSAIETKCSLTIRRYKVKLKRIQELRDVAVTSGDIKTSDNLLAKEQLLEHLLEHEHEQRRLKLRETEPEMTFSVDEVFEDTVAKDGGQLGQLQRVYRILSGFEHRRPRLVDHKFQLGDIELTGSRLTIGEGVLRTHRKLFPPPSELKGLAITSFVLSFICPYTKQRLQRPVRGTQCKHVDCFELEEYFNANSGLYSKFRCPLCKAPTNLCDLVQDDFFVDLMEFAQDDNKVELLEGDDSITARLLEEEQKQDLMTDDIAEVLEVTVYDKTKTSKAMKRKRRRQKRKEPESAKFLSENIT